MSWIDGVVEIASLTYPGQSDFGDAVAAAHSGSVVGFQ